MIIFLVIAVLVHGEDASTSNSKACFGNLGASGCTRHRLTCQPNNQICITAAYCINNNFICDFRGISVCPNSFPSIQGSTRTYFNSSEMDRLLKCSLKDVYNFEAPRRKPNSAYSVVAYRCINAQTKFSVTCDVLGDRETTPFNFSPLSTNPSSMTGSVSAGSVVGGVIGGACVVVLVGILVFVFLRRRKPQRDRDGTAERKETNLNLDKQHIYHEIEPANSQGNVYLTLNPDHTKTGSSSVHLKTDGTALDTIDSSNGYFTLFPGTANRGFSPGTEDKYNHIKDDKTVTGSQYDTIESDNQYFTLFPDQNNPISGNTKPTPGDEYNRVGDIKAVKGSQYDTMESACRFVKRQELGDGHEDYDHLDGQPTSPKMESSDYYTVSFTENGSSTPTGERYTSEVVRQVPKHSAL